MRRSILTDADGIVAVDRDDRQLHVRHYLVYPPQAKHRRAVRTFAKWIAQELDLR
jgi:DNA-binding transcriptional LysR family regulator